MSLESSKKKVLKQLELELKKDRVYTEFVSLSPLNLLQMTRKRTGPSLQTILCETCEVCKGDGLVRTPKTVSSDIFKEIEWSFRDSFSIKKRLLMSLKRKKETLQITACPLVISWIKNHEKETIDFLKKTISSNFVLKEDKNFHQEQFEVSPLET